MKSTSIVAFGAAALLATAACDKEPTKLDALAQSASSTIGGGGGGDTSELAARVARLEQSLAAREDALKFLDAVYEDQLERSAKPKPGAIYGVDIQQNLDANHVEGSRDALVTIVEAFDFA